MCERGEGEEGVMKGEQRFNSIYATRKRPRSSVSGKNRLSRTAFSTHIYKGGKRIEGK